jgi:hypothetical protein
VRAGSQPVGWGLRLDRVSPFQSTESARAGCDGG